MRELYLERRGPLTPSGRTVALAEPLVVWSNLEPGEAPSSSQDGVTIKHVASGGPVYHSVGGRTYKVSPRQFICIPAGVTGTAAIRKGGERTHGFCVFIPSAQGHRHEELDLPFVLPTVCSPLGRLLDASATAMSKPALDRSAIAAALLGGVMANIETLFAEVEGQLEGLGMARKLSRFESYRKLNLVRAFLHEVTDRVVPLTELATTAGMSQFQLLRRFRDTFGETPSAYHRRLRLRLAKEAVATGACDCQTAADMYGFAGGSSFSHAHRRAFGVPPVRTLSRAKDGSVDMVSEFGGIAA